MAVITVDESNFKMFVLENKKTVLVDFWASWCMPCKAISPIVDELAEDLSGTIVVTKVNIDDCEKIAAQYAIMSIPTLMVFKDGKSVDQIIGLRSKQQIYDMVKKHL